MPLIPNDKSERRDWVYCGQSWRHKTTPLRSRRHQWKLHCAWDAILVYFIEYSGLSFFYLYISPSCISAVVWIILRLQLQCLQYPTPGIPLSQQRDIPLLISNDSPRCHVHNMVFITLPLTSFLPFYSTWDYLLLRYAFFPSKVNHQLTLRALQ